MKIHKKTVNHNKGEGVTVFTLKLVINNVQILCDGAVLVAVCMSSDELDAIVVQNCNLETRDIWWQEVTVPRMVQYLRLFVLDPY